ncbi:MAG: PspA/IM30 family protein [Planctomycetota bacterium]
MGFLQRMRDLVAANLHDLVDRCEDPEKMLKHAVRGMERDAEGALQAAVQALASEKLLARELAASRAEAAAQRQHAGAALRTGDEAVARDALGHAVDADTVAAALTTQVAACAGAAARARQQVAALHARIARARHELRTLSVLRRGVEVARRSGGVAGASARAGEPRRGAAFEHRLAVASAETEAWCEVAGPELEPAALVSAHEQRRRAVDAELDRLRAEAASR